jgi:hypothetical protein
MSSRRKTAPTARAPAPAGAPALRRRPAPAAAGSPGRRLGWEQPSGQHLHSAADSLAGEALSGDRFPGFDLAPQAIEFGCVVGRPPPQRGRRQIQPSPTQIDLRCEQLARAGPGQILRVARTSPLPLNARTLRPGTASRSTVADEGGRALASRVPLVAVPGVGVAVERALLQLAASSRRESAAPRGPRRRARRCRRPPDRCRGACCPPGGRPWPLRSCRADGSPAPAQARPPPHRRDRRRSAAPARATASCRSAGPARSRDRRTALTRRRTRERSAEVIGSRMTAKPGGGGSKFSGNASIRIIARLLEQEVPLRQRQLPRRLALDQRAVDAHLKAVRDRPPRPARRRSA